MHESLFAHAAHAEGATVLRLALRPYSIGHEILLWKTSNPLATYRPESFAELEETVQRQKLFSACFICERTWAENQRSLRWPRLTKFFRRQCSTKNEIKKFRAYRDAAGADLPAVKMPRVAGAHYHYFGAPDIARLLPFVAGINLGFATPFDFPLGLARQLYSASMEAAGHQWIQNFQDVEAQEKLAAFEKSHPESTLAVGDEAVKAAAEKWNAEHPEAKVPLPNPKANGANNA